MPQCSARACNAGLVLFLILATSSASARVPDEEMPNEDMAIANPDIWPQPEWPLRPNTAHERRIARLLESMTVEEKVGQILQADISMVTPDDVRQYHLGAVLNGGNSGPYGDDKAAKEKWLELADEYYAASMDTSDGGAAIPILWGTDAVHGHSNIIGATLFPHNIGLGAMQDPDLIERIGQATALEIRATGQEWTFAPTLAIPQDFRWGRAYEGYSTDPALVSEYAASMIRGLQGAPDGKPILEGPHVLATAKHYLADGGTQYGIDQGDARISETELRDVHGGPYITAIENAVGSVMASFSSWNGVRMTGNRSLLTAVLKRRMNFAGFVVSDWNAHAHLPGCTTASCPDALRAGIDMYMAPDSWRALSASLNAQVDSGDIPMQRLDDAVRRILRAKMRLGLFDAGKPSSRRYAGNWSLIGAPAHRAIAREAVRKSLVLLKYQSGLLPLKPGTSLLVAGNAADDIGRQSGGWTITWQGTGVSREDFPGATSLWQGLLNAIAAAGGTAEFEPEGNFSNRPDAAVVVLGETPYAEFQGDLESLQLTPADRRPYRTMQRLKAQGIPVVAVMITGRPLFMNPELNVADDFIVAWLPGSEGAGLADLLVAPADEHQRFDFTGKLPAAWPGSPTQGDVLFSRGYGLSLDGPRREWQRLEEDRGKDHSPQMVWFDKGVPTASWALVVGDSIKSGTRITTVPAVAAEGRMHIGATDFGVQEGARTFYLSEGQASIALSTHDAIDIYKSGSSAALLTFTLRIENAPVMPLTLSISNGDSRAGVSLDALSEVQDATTGWQTYAVPVACFRAQGVDTRHIDTPFRLTLHGPATLSLARVALGGTYDVLLDCAD